MVFCNVANRGSLSCKDMYCCCSLMPEAVAVTIIVTGSNSLAKVIRYLCI